MRSRHHRRGLRFLFSFFILIFATAFQLRAAECDPALLEQLLTQGRGPFNQPLVGQTIETAGGRVWAVGTDTAMANIDAKAAEVNRTLRNVTGEGADGIIVARAITGSLARLKLMKVANDLDFEGLLVVHQKRGNVESLHDPKSPEIRKLVRFFQLHVERVLRENPDYRFIELKAGEFFDARAGENKGIKWWLEDVRRGYKVIEEPAGKRTVTLAEVFAADARVKADWAVPAPHDGPIRGAYTEASVLYRFGMRIGNNQVRLRLSRNGHSDESLPVRATTVALDAADMDIMLEASQATRSAPLEQVHQLILHSMKKYLEIDHLKIIKRVFSLLQFWDEVGDYNALKGTHFTQESLSRDFLSVLSDPRLIELGQLKAQGELLKIAEEHRLELPNDARSVWVAEVRRRHGVTADTIDAIVVELAAKLDKIIGEELAIRPHLDSYVNFVVGKIPYTEGELSSGPLFLTLKPNAEFVAKLARRIARWKKQYPHLKFHHPEDVHMTIQFLGRMTARGAQALREGTRGQGEGWAFGGGGLHVIGRNSDLVSLTYDVTPAVVEAVNVARGKASSFGARPEKRFRIYKPHLTLASVDAKSPEGRAELDRFLQENASALETVAVEGMEIWTRIESPAPAPGGREYRPYR